MLRVLGALRALRLAAAQPQPPACAARWISAAQRRMQAHSTAPGAVATQPDATRASWVPRRQQRRRQPFHTCAASSESSGGMAGEVCSLKCCLLDVPGGVAEEVAEVLLAYGAQSVAVEEYRPDGAREQEIFADEHAEGRVWDRCIVVAYFPPEEVAAAGLLETTAADFGLSHQHVSVEAVRTQDWEQSIKSWEQSVQECGLLVPSYPHFLPVMPLGWEQGLRDSYQPAQVGEGLWIVPVWSQPPDPAAVNIRLEPGLAFGTGDHPTTRLCLRWLQALQQRGVLQGAAVMDYGTGSGVLAVAALLMGAARAVGTDIEPLAVKATVSNAALNSVADRLDAYACAASLEQQEPLAAAGVPEERRQFEVTVANILQGPLVALAPRLAAYTKPGGLLGLSGILQEQTPAVLEAYGPYFEGFEVQTEDRWALVTAVRKQQ